MKRNNLSLREIARIGLFLDDPYGDGIRLKRVREPSVARKYAMIIVSEELDFVKGGEIDLIVREEYEARVLDKENWNRNGTLKSWISRNLKQTKKSVDIPF